MGLACKRLILAADKLSLHLCYFLELLYTNYILGIVESV